MVIWLKFNDIFQSYLKTLKKKQKEVTQKHQKAEGGVSFVTEDSGNNKYIDNNGPATDWSPYSVNQILSFSFN